MSAVIDRDESGTLVHLETQYRYSPDGIRTRAEQTAYTLDDGGGPVNQTLAVRTYLIDPSGGHTGFAQVLEERDGSDATLRTYTIGDDVLVRQGGGLGVKCLLTDGLGSVRALTNLSGFVSDEYHYDSYGDPLTFAAGATTEPKSRLLHAGEQYDTDLQQTYLRARYYDPGNGRFNRVDPFAGNNFDPQSLHKYAYAHSDPVNSVDPSGENRLTIGIIIVFAIIGAIIGELIGFAIGGVKGAVIGSIIGLIVGLFIGIVWGVPLVLWAMNMWARLGVFLAGGGVVGSQVLRGPNGQVTVQRLNELGRMSSSRVTLWTRISSTPTSQQALHTATNPQLANAANRSSRHLFRLDVPKLVLNALERVGLVQRRIVYELDGTQGIEYRFQAQVVGYILQFMEQVE